MKWTDRKHIFWHIAISVLGIACFPANPLVFTGIVETEFYPASFTLGCLVWIIGMALVMAPFIMFPKHGDVPKGKSFVHTTKLVNTGIYAVVRHPQYLGGILSIFITTLLWYPHWLFAVLGITGVFVVYWSARAEDRTLVEQFGDEYIDYMIRVPRMNIVLGFIRLLKGKQSGGKQRDCKFIQDELQDFKDCLREGLLKYTREAFQILPPMEKPCILDIGCGSGVPTMELARLSGGEVTGIDTNQIQLDRLIRRVKNAGLSGRVKALNRSMLDIGFDERSFDIIWAEGAIAIIGFDRGLKEWYRFLKSGGFLVVHDDLGNLIEKTEQISRYGYQLIDHFIMNEEIWWNEYYAPLEKKLDEILVKNADDKIITELLSSDQREVDGFKKDHERYRSVFFAIKKG